MTYETMSFEQEGHVGIITLRRPDRLNALNVRMLEELRQAVDHIQNDETIRVVILTGGPDSKGRPCFCAGADMKEAPFPDSFLQEVNDLFNGIENLNKATIAAVDGVCTAGGLELSMCFDLRVVAETARIGDLHLKNLGVGLGGAGASTRLPRIVGLANAKELMFTGDLIDGHEAYRMGLANKVCTPDNLMVVTRAMGLKIADMRPRGLAVTKMHLNLGTQMEQHQALQFAEILGPFADAEGMRELEKKQAAFGSKNKKTSEQRSPGNAHQGEPTLTGKAVPIKPGLFTLPTSSGELPQLIGTKCKSCHEIFFPPMRETCCPNCHETDMEELLLSKNGTVISYTIVHMPPKEWQGPVPYAVALIELSDGATFYSALTDCKPEEVNVGMEVELAIEKLRTDDDGNDVVGYKFSPIGKS
jgi:enoyl-CoA hydratase